MWNNNSTSHSTTDSCCPGYKGGLVGFRAEDLPLGIILTRWGSAPSQGQDPALPVADAAAAFLGLLGSSKGGSAPAQGRSQGGSAPSQGQDPVLPVVDAAAAFLGLLVVLCD